MKFDLNPYNLDTKKMIRIPLFILVICIGILFSFFVIYDTPVRLGYDFTGGTVITVPSTKDVGYLEEKYQAYDLLFVRDMGSRTMLQFGFIDPDKGKELRESIIQEYGEENVQLDYSGATFGEEMQRLAIIAIIFSFILMAIVVFVAFRIPLPSCMITFCALSDIIMAMAMMDIFGIELTLGSLAALLMLIGYSVDTDILLTNKVLKEGKNTKDDFKRIFNTGFTMTTTTLVAVVVMFIVSTFSYLFTSYTQITILSEMSAVLIFGLLADMLNTWLMNAGFLRLYIDKRGKRR
ncbi:MAG: protein translocase subunit SecF [Candidatus Methanoliparum thermophilum]|uniref:Protein-export membrane protein SecF n=1 Tax=Methanoliparum thermophilum TaxID=2491083 RepID=A0A520KSY1_METT2|nr:MAG: protein translocase subunit SecF [Candidatus Methanoliparum thermophilum]